MEFYMTSLRHTALSIAIAAASLGTFAQTAAEHTQHHPEELAKKATKAVTQVREDLPAHRRLQDRRDDPQIATAVRAVLQVKVESASFSED
jgi:hypothetical protein